ncbi:hypothetical protein [Pseudomonas quasicaspiana]|uniref:hypothetical protein n=1 Tax=Pseudomonas quasicaspiana TaxID=2829821 RepID=UPI001E2976E9|nr:hypothetical protein [Pseudomonas quasicaspiana]MCD5969671.1 hypothetical protein [Pseudomonas quasicaspiana]
MLKNKKLLLGMVVSAVISAGSHSAWAQTVPEGSATQTASAPVMEEPVFNVLTDKVHTVGTRLNSAVSEHYYGFTAVRGQDVILDLKSQQHIKVERHVGGAWVPVTVKGISVLKNLKPGEEIIIRVTHNQAVAFNGGQYSLVFGSYPVLMDFDLNPEENVLRIPYGYSDPAWLPGQAHKEATVVAQFTDTTGAPLEGGIVSFRLNFNGGYRENISDAVISDGSGRVTKLLEIGPCQGGDQARDYFEYRQGYNNTWRTNYHVGEYYYLNYLVRGEVSEKYNFGHICHQRLISSKRS